MWPALKLNAAQVSSRAGELNLINANVEYKA